MVASHQKLLVAETSQPAMGREWDRQVYEAKQHMAKIIVQGNEVVEVVGHYMRKRDWLGSLRLVREPCAKE